MKTNLWAVIALCVSSGLVGWGMGVASAETGDSIETLSQSESPSAASAIESAEPVELQGSCGDYQCDPPEDCHSCPSDCGSCCGNNRCEPPEDSNSCPEDC